MEKLTERLDKTDLSDREKLILTIAPGCLFGCPPPNLTELIERIDCQICMDIAQKSLRMVKILEYLEKRVNEVCGPVRKENKERRDWYEKNSQIFFFGWFVRLRPPQYSAEPNYKKEMWYIENMRKVEMIVSEMAILKAKDVPHWIEEGGIGNSQEFVRLVVGKDNSYVL